MSPLGGADVATWRTHGATNRRRWAPVILIGPDFDSSCPMQSMFNRTIFQPKLLNAVHDYFGRKMCFITTLPNANGALICPYDVWLAITKRIGPIHIRCMKSNFRTRWTIIWRTMCCMQLFPFRTLPWVCLYDVWMANDKRHGLAVFGSIIITCH